MRDPKRIDKVLAALRAAWTMQPDTRLTQLIANATGISGGVGEYAFSRLYQTEDEDTLLGLAAMVATTAQAAPEGLVSAGSSLRVSLPCRACEGSGKVDHDPNEQPCPTCRGSGKEWHDIEDAALFPPCQPCQGSGVLPSMGSRAVVCSACGGRGRKRP